MDKNAGAASLVRSDALLARLEAEANCRREDTHGRQLIDDAVLEIRCLRAALEESHRMQKIMVAGLYGISNAQISGGTLSAESDCSVLRKRIADLEEGLRKIAVWTQEDQDDHDICVLQWRGCVAIARELLKPNARNQGQPPQGETHD